MCARTCIGIVRKDVVNVRKDVVNVCKDVHRDCVQGRA
jgi:hypothetical protein